MRNNRVASGRWRACRALVVDEVSMLDSDFFDKVEEVARRMRDSEQPFGGVQLVLCGGRLRAAWKRPGSGLEAAWKRPGSSLSWL